MAAIALPQYWTFAIMPAEIDLSNAWILSLPGMAADVARKIFIAAGSVAAGSGRGLQKCSAYRAEADAANA
jgi:hypothetical protein